MPAPRSPSLRVPACLAATLLAIAPLFLVLGHDDATHRGPTLAYAACGLACGLLVRFWSPLFGVAGYIVPIAWLTLRGRLGHGGEGDLLYGAALLLTGVFVACALVGAGVATLVARRLR